MPTRVEALYTQVLSEMQRVLAPKGRIVLLTNAPQRVNLEGVHCQEKIEISLFGQNPTIMVLHSET